MCVLYLRPPGRRPVRTTPWGCLGDVQGAIPYGWCRGCGREVFMRGGEKCPVCAKEEENEPKEMSQPL